ncbi:MAG: hypothetical protein MUO43_14625, partial [Desulfobacterales bacterium]|nr:hypothetical protein [Desulfobacterales bacterium]
ADGRTGLAHFYAADALPDSQLACAHADGAGAYNDDLFFFLQELMDLKVEKNTELKFTRQLLEVNEKKVSEKELLIAELKKELA